MSATGTIDAVQFKRSKAGKTYGKVSINGGEYLVFGKTLDSLKGANEGDSVEFSAKPSDNGDGQILTFLEVKSNGGGASGPAKQAAPPQGRSTATRGGGDNVQLSIFYGYAKDLVNAGVIKTPVTSPQAVVDLISTTAKELMRRFALDNAPTDAPAPKPEPAAPTAPTPTVNP